MTRIFIEDQELDASEFTHQITYAVDDLQNLDSKSTPFSKTVILPGTARNNSILGNIFDINNANFTNDNERNVGYNFNAAKSAKCRVEVNGLQIIKGVFRLLEIIIDGDFVEYEAQVLGELGGFYAKLGNRKLEEIDMSEHDHTYSMANITASWDNANDGEGYYYPLIDYGNVSDDKVHFQYTAFRPAYFVREFIDKIITGNGYTWESDFFNTNFFKRLIIPNNQKNLTKTDETDYIQATFSGTQTDSGGFFLLGIEVPTQTTLNTFTTADDIVFAYAGVTTINTKITARIQGTYTSPSGGNMELAIMRGLDKIAYEDLPIANTSASFDVTLEAVESIESGQSIALRALHTGTPGSINITSVTLSVINEPPGNIPLVLGDELLCNSTLPKGIMQKDFFASILKMFYLMVTEDKFKEKHLIIEPYPDFFDTDRSTFQDWSDKLDRSQPIRVKPMAQLNARYYQVKYKADNDYFNEEYRKKYNQGYGDRIYDTVYDFAKETDTVEVIFSSSVLWGAEGTDKVYPAIYKRTAAGFEDRMESNIRIMQAKKITSVTNWNILENDTVLQSQTYYPYAGHFDDPDAPNADLNFGAPREVFFALVAGNLGNNLFNTYYSPYLSEITHKDSRVLTGMFRLTPQDIYDLDFRKFIWIDGSLFRIAKVQDFNTSGQDLTRVELLKVIYTTY